MKDWAALQRNSRLLATSSSISLSFKLMGWQLWSEGWNFVTMVLVQ